MSGFDWAFAGKVVWVLFILVWVGIRIPPNRRARRVGIARRERPPVEQFSLAVSFCGLGLIPGIWVFTGFPEAFDTDRWPLSVLIGAVLLIASLWLFRVTHKALGAMWSNSLDLRKEHKLVTEGVYRHVRHPMYSAFWLWAVGQAFLLGNWIAAFAGIVGFGTLYALRVGREEAMMRSQFGADYDVYCAKTARIIPGVL